MKEPFLHLGSYSLLSKITLQVHKWKDSLALKLLFPGAIKFHSEYCLMFIVKLWDYKVHKNF